MFDWWHWTLFGFTLLVVELLMLNSFYLLWFGVGALLVAVLVTLTPMLAWVQVLWWVAFSLVLLLVWLRWMRPRRTRRLLAQAQTELPGHVGVVVRFHAGRGVVRLQKPIGGRDLWDFRSEVTRKAGESLTLSQLLDDGTVQAQDAPHNTQS